MHPIGPLEDHVAIKPRNILYILRNGSNCNIKEPLFLPEYGATRDLYENVGILTVELKAPIKRKLHGYERNREIGSKYSVV